MKFKDPVTFEVYRNALMGLCEEMGLVIARTAHSTIITTGLDFSTALADADGRVLVQSNGIMSQVGAYPYAMNVVRKQMAGRMKPGDVYIFNDTDEVSMHLNDVFVVKPYFVGDELIAFGLCTAHHVDVGGMVSGSMDISASEIYQEGLQIPVVKLYDGGEPNRDVVDMIMRNIRLPALFEGDVHSQVAALHSGEVGIAALVERFSADRFRELNEELLDYSEFLTANAIEQIPDGTYEFDEFLDDDGLSPDHPLIHLHVTVIVEGDTIVVDWDGTDPQVTSSINVHFTHTRALSYGAVMGVLQEDIPNNDGFYRKVTVRAPEGCIVNVQRPAARSMRAALVYRMMDALMGALYKAVPDRVPAGSCGGTGLLQVSGYHPTRGRFVDVDPIWSGWGGRPGLDGLDFASPFSSNISAHSVEMTEQKGVLRYESLGFEPDTGGAGKWRGCLSLRVVARAQLDDTTLRVQSYRHKTQPYGLDGGHSGTSSRIVLNPGTSHERELPGSAKVVINRGDVVDYTHSSAGGYGEPFERDPDAVLRDVLDEKISSAYAEREYGVSIDPERGVVDRAKTTEQRRAHAAAEPT